MSQLIVIQPELRQRGQWSDVCRLKEEQIIKWMIRRMDFKAYSTFLASLTNTRGRTYSLGYILRTLLVTNSCLAWIKIPQDKYSRSFTTDNKVKIIGNVIIQLMVSLWVWPKVITLSKFYCILVIIFDTQNSWTYFLTTVNTSIVWQTNTNLT